MASQDEDTFLKSLQNVRQVCKAWKAASADYTGPTKTCGSLNLCKLLPSISSVHVMVQDSDKLDTKLLGSLTGLSCMVIEQKDRASRAQVLDLENVPPTTRALTAPALTLHSRQSSSREKPDPLENINCTGLTRLKFGRAHMHLDEVIDLLQHLPELQVHPPPCSVAFMIVTLPSAYCLSFGPT